MAKNPCQYWVEDEPVVCKYWDVALTLCTYTDFTDGKLKLAQKAPYCNLLGTSYYSCRQYTSSAEDASATRGRCVLPDPSRQASKHDDCTIWVKQVVSGTRNVTKYLDKPVYELDSSGQPEKYLPASYWTFADINGYNNGDCDGKGTTVTCSGYSPYSLGFGPLRPQELTSEILAYINDPEKFDIPYCITASGLGFRDPLSLSAFNLRATLGRCKWWNGAPEVFSIDSSKGTVNVIDYLCSNPDEKTNLFQYYQLTEENGYIAPCNGAKPECPGYASNICWQYVIDDYTAEGDKVLAEQILELRYYARKERWQDLVTQVFPGETEPLYQNYYNYYFLEPDLYSWAGTLDLSITERNTLSAIIPAVKNYFLHFDYFEVFYSTLSLTAGIPTRSQPSYFPTLIRELNFKYLRPIIRTEFDKETLNADSPVDTVFRPNNVFETYDLDHKYLAIWGDNFYYNSYVIAINFSDPDLSRLSNLYNYISEYQSMSDIQSSLSEEKFSEFYTELDRVLNTLISFFPEKVFYSKLNANTNAFYIDTETFFGDNNIVVFDSTTGFWEYDKISVVKVFMGAVIGQTSFIAEGDGGTIVNLPDYCKGFNSTVNKNCSVGFTLFPVRQDGNTSEIAYVYNNTLSDGKYCFQKYKVKVFENLKLHADSVKFIGNDGTAVVIVPDPSKKLHNVHYPWGIEGDILLTFVDPEGTMQTINMNIVPTTKESLEVNQLVIEPANKKEFKSPCSFELLLGEYVYTYEKRSFGQTPNDSYEEVFASENVQAITGDLEITDNRVTISNFPDYGILASVVYKTSRGRLKGITRSKLLTWIRQPYCRDFEIKYLWDLEYVQWDLYPRGNCDYKQTNSVLNKSIGKQRRTFGPSCADHDKSTRTAAAPMWYPYDQCASEEKHHIISSAHGNIFDTMSIFNTEAGSGEKLYGNWNLRMLGPVENYGTEESHASIWDCSCDFWYFNHVKASDNMFSGYARYRGGLSAYDYEICIRDEGTPPKFGNVYREQLNSYRSLDRVKYYKVNGASYIEDYRWMPAAEYFTQSNIFTAPDSVGQDLYTDDYNSPCYSQLGLLIATSAIEGINIKETVDYETRYSFDELFRTNLSISLVYPKARPSYVYLYNGELRDIISWYTYKDITDSSKSVQWAWREYWGPIERSSNKQFYLDLLSGLADDNPLEYSSLSFLDIDYPDYVYDAKQQEHRHTVSEGYHTIACVVSTPAGEASSENIEPYILLQLDEGPPRVFNLDGNWLGTDDIPATIQFEGYDLSEVKAATEKYISTPLENSGWAIAVDLFEEDTINTAEEAKAEGQYLFMYDSSGIYYEKYYKRGLVVVPNIGRFDLLPKRFLSTPASDYEWKFSATPTLLPDSVLSNIVPDEYFPGTIYLDGAEYTAGQPNTLTIIVDFSKGSEEFIPKVLTRLDIKLKYSVDLTELIAYNIPKIELYRGEGLSDTFELVGLVEKDIASFNSTDIYKTITINIPYDYLSFKTPSKYFKFVIDTALPASDDRSASQGDLWSLMDNRISIKEIKFTEVALASVTENIFTYERKYYASTGSHGDVAPHGNSITGEILNVPTEEMSTAYHTDTSVGILGVANSGQDFTTMNKCRGRILKPCHQDKEPYVGTDIHNMEKEQKIIHDSVAIDVGETTFSMQSVVPPGLQYKLDALDLVFPTWECVFENTTTLELASVKPQANFNDKGHRWSYDDYTPQNYYCGRGVYIDFFEYQYIDIATRASYGSYSWLESQYQAAVNRFEYGFWLYLADALTGGGKTTIFYTGGQTTVETDKLTSLIFL